MAALETLTKKLEQCQIPLAEALTLYDRVKRLLAPLRRWDKDQETMLMPAVTVTVGLHGIGMFVFGCRLIA